MNALHLLGTLTGEIEAGTSHIVGSHILKHAGQPLIGVELRDAGTEVCDHSRTGAELEDSICIRISERLEQYRIHDTENCGVSPNAQRQRRNSGDGETGILQQRSECVPDLIDQIVH